MVKQEVQSHAGKAPEQDVFSGRIGLERIKLLRTLFSAKHTSYLMKVLDSNHLPVRNMTEYVANPEMQRVVMGMLGEREKFAFQLGVLFATVPFSTFSQEVQESLSPQKTSSDVNIVPFSPPVILCNTSELYLRQSLEEKTTITIDGSDAPSLLTKVRGKTSGLCINDTLGSNDRVFVAGCWYTPGNADTADAMKETFLSGTSRTPFSPSTWTLMRGIRPLTYETFASTLSAARNTADSAFNEAFPGLVKVEGQHYSRQTYFDSLNRKL